METALLRFLLCTLAILLCVQVFILPSLLDTTGEGPAAPPEPENGASIAPPPLDPNYDLILDPHLARNEYPAEKLAAARRLLLPSLAAQFCTPEVWAKYKDVKSSGPAKWTLARAINTGVMYPESLVGCHAGDRESYDDFKDFFWPVIEAYHVGFSMASGWRPPGTATERMDPSRVTVQLSDSARAKILSTRIRIARNLAAFALNPGGDRRSREAIADLMGRVFRAPAWDPALAGTFFLHSNLTGAQREALVKDRLLFRGGDKMQAASGYHEHWPHGRGVFLSADKAFSVWVNEGDHLRVISVEQGGDVRGVFSRLSAGARAIEEGVRRLAGPKRRNGGGGSGGSAGSRGGGSSGVPEEVFMVHPKFGSVACCPSNIGTGMRGSVHMRLPRLLASLGLEGVDAMARPLYCQARGSDGERSVAAGGRVDVSNWRRVGRSEYELVDDMLRCANALAHEEDALAQEEAAGSAELVRGST